MVLRTFWNQGVGGGLSHKIVRITFKALKRGILGFAQALFDPYGRPYSNKARRHCLFPLNISLHTTLNDTFIAKNIGIPS